MEQISPRIELASELDLPQASNLIGAYAARPRAQNTWPKENTRQFVFLVASILSAAHVGVFPHRSTDSNARTGAPGDMPSAVPPIVVRPLQQRLASSQPPNTRSLCLRSDSPSVSCIPPTCSLSSSSRVPALGLPAQQAEAATQSTHSQIDEGASGEMQRAPNYKEWGRPAFSRRSTATHACDQVETVDTAL